MTIKLKKAISLSVAAGLFLQLSACGTVLYPERKGQTSGRLDTGVVALNAIGLLFFLVPGVIAFAVDFNNGTIYLPNSSSSLESEEVNLVSIEGELTNENIEQVVFDRTGKVISLKDPTIQSIKQLATRDNIVSGVKLL